MKFIDSIQILVKAGKGGDGIVSFKSAKGKPKLGPDGGDGGMGGTVYLQGNKQLNTLSMLRYRAVYRAEDGSRGGSKGCTGRAGEDLVVHVPLGTVVVDHTQNKVLGELLQDGELLQVAKGGLKGLGNMRWLSSTHQAPEEHRPGARGEERELRLDLKLLADVGLAGFPNAGKSTLLSKISAARPKIADYPFTTLVPNLGVVDLPMDNGYEVASFVAADVPGLVEGASEGRGLGHTFLKHLERTSVILYVIDASDFERTPVQAYECLRTEMQRFSTELYGRHAVVALNKNDQAEPDQINEAQEAFASMGLQTFVISGLTGQGLKELKWHLFHKVREVRAREAEPVERTGRDSDEVLDFIFDTDQSSSQPVLSEPRQ